jgi:8-oxo-dGTP diphosphatase
MEEITLIQTARNAGIGRFVVGAVVWKLDKALILKRAANDFMGGIYELPSGRVEEGEDLIQALHRELYEETGLEVVKETYLNFFDYLSKSGRKTRQFNYIVTTKNNDVRLSDEHEDVAWAAVNDLGSFNVTQPVIDTITEASKHLSS